MTPESGQGDSWEEVGGSELIRWDVPKQVEGIFRGGVEVTGQFGKQTRFTLQRDNGESADFFAPAILERMLTDARVTVGARIRIEYSGQTEKTKSGRMAKSFVVSVKK